MGQNIYIYHIQLTVTLYEFLGGLEGFGRVWVTIYIYIAVPNVVRVWHFTVCHSILIGANGSVTREEGFRPSLLVSESDW